MEKVQRTTHRDKIVSLLSTLALFSDDGLCTSKKETEKRDEARFNKQLLTIRQRNLFTQ